MPCPVDCDARLGAAVTKMIRRDTGFQIAAAAQGRTSACTEPTTELMKSANGSLVTTTENR